MNEANTKALIGEFPGLFPPCSFSSDGYMDAGFECGDGWLGPVRDLLAELDGIRCGLPAGDELWVVQVAERFGSLRCYVSGAREPFFSRAQDAIDRAEAAAGKTCEECGQAGRLRTFSGPEMAVLCDQHASMWVSP